MSVCRCTIWDCIFYFKQSGIHSPLFSDTCLWLAWFCSEVWCCMLRLSFAGSTTTRSITLPVLSHWQDIDDWKLKSWSLFNDLVDKYPALLNQLAASQLCRMTSLNSSVKRQQSHVVTLTWEGKLYSKMSTAYTSVKNILLNDSRNEKRMIPQKILVCVCARVSEWENKCTWIC